MNACSQCHRDLTEAACVWTCDPCSKDPEAAKDEEVYCGAACLGSHGAAKHRAFGAIIAGTAKILARVPVEPA